MLRTLLVVAGGMLCACSAIAAEPERITIATWNLEWFFDHDTKNNRSELSREQSAPSQDEWDWKRTVVAQAVANMQPTILAVQEIEDRSALYQLDKTLRDLHGLTYREAFIEGNDFATEQDVGLIAQHGLVEFSRREPSTAQRTDERYYPLHKHLIARFEFGSGDDIEQLLLVNVHFRAMPEGAKIRQRQARLLRTWIDAALARGENVIVLGDFNSDLAFEKTTADSEIGILRGLETATTDDDLIDLHEQLPADERATHLNQAQYDRVFISPALRDDNPKQVDLVFKTITRAKAASVRGEHADRDHWNNFYKIPQAERDASDHYPLLVEFERR